MTNGLEQPRPPLRADGRPLPGTAIFVATLGVAYAITLVVGISHHELWRDEAKAWLIARDSNSISELFHNRRYEGHPILWYLPLYGASRLTYDPDAMQWVHAVIATAAVVVFAWRAPFSWAQKILFAAGVYPLFEYGVVSRGYSLGVLLLWSLLSLHDARAARRPISLAILLALLANTSLHGLLIAVAYVTAWVVSVATTRRVNASTAMSRPLETLATPTSTAAPAPATGPPVPRRLAAAGAVVALGFAAAAWQIVPPPPAGVDAARFASINEPRFAGLPPSMAVGTVWEGYVPVPNVRVPWLYENAWIPATRPGRVARVAVSVLLLAGAAAALRRSKPALAFFLVGTSLTLALTWLKFGGSLRHHGHLFVILLAACWIAYRAAKPPGRKASAALTTLLALHAAVGAYYWVADVREPFSPSREAARVLRGRYGDAFVLVNNPGNHGSAVQAYLDARVYFPARRAWGRFELLDGTPKRASRQDLVEALSELCERGSGTVLLLSSSPVKDLGPTLRLVPVASLRQTLSGEAYDIYEVYSVQGTGDRVLKASSEIIRNSSQ